MSCNAHVIYQGSLDRKNVIAVYNYILHDLFYLIIFDSIKTLNYN